MSFFNNREIAIILWVLIFFVLVLFYKKNCASLFSVLKIITSKKFILLIFSMLLYVSLIIYLFHKIGLWDTSVIKDSILWFFGVAFIMVVNSNKASEAEHYFQKVLLDNLKLVVLLEFIINLYVFNLAIEIILIPILFIIVVLLAYAESKKEYVDVKKVLDYILGIIGICFIIFALSNIFMNFPSFANLDNLRSFLLPPILTLAFLPFIYLFALYIVYESFFLRIDIFNENKAITRYAKRKIFALCHLNLRRLNKLSRKVGSMKINNKNDVLKIFKKFKGD